jgi:Phage integrase family
VNSEGAKPSDRVFNESQMVGDYVTQTFARACREVSIADFKFHDLRHTAASWMRMSGADIHTVAQVLGHKDLRMAARYQHLSPAFLSDAVKRLDLAFANRRICPGRKLPRGVYRHHSVTKICPWAAKGTRQRSNQLIGLSLIGSVIGDRTRTLRLERAAC